MASQTFADDIRERSDEQLTSLLTRRPDLLNPMPADLTTLAVRATSIPSLNRALDLLTVWEYDLLTASATMDEPFTLKNLQELIGVSIEADFERLYELGMFYMDGKKYRIPTNLRTLIGEDPAGLGPKQIIDCDFNLLKSAPKESKVVLEHLTWDQPRGQVSNLKSPPAGVAWLLENDFLTVINKNTVALPKEVGLFLRGNKIFQNLRNFPPEISTSKLDFNKIDTAAIANITEILRLTEELAQFWANDPAEVIKAGGVGVRDLKRSSEHLGLEEDLTKFIAQLLFNAGLIAIDPSGEVLPTNQYDIWIKKDVEEKWIDLVAAWVVSQSYLGGNNTILTEDNERPALLLLRNIYLKVLSEFKGQTFSREEILRRLEWQAPRRFNPDYYIQISKELEWLGFTGQNTISSFGLKFLAPESDLGIKAAAPKPIDYILIQSDYTAIAPGPLDLDIANELELLADIEGRGSATVFRFTENSIRRGLDHGLHSTQILEFLKKVSKTPMPQPLEYLVQDVSKRHGKLRIGSAVSFVRSEDEKLLAEILANKNLEHIGLRKIASQVLISDLELDELLQQLRNQGYFPVGESKSGALLTAPIARRTKLRKSNNTFKTEKEKNSTDLISTAIKALRVGDKVTKIPSFELPRNSASATLQQLTAHLEANETIAIGYADSNGVVANRLIDPISIRQGLLTAKDHASNKIEAFRISRITGVIPHRELPRK